MELIQWKKASELPLSDISTPVAYGWMDELKVVSYERSKYNDKTLFIDFDSDLDGKRFEGFFRCGFGVTALEQMLSNLRTRCPRPAQRGIPW